MIFNDNVKVNDKCNDNININVKINDNVKKQCQCQCMIQRVVHVHVCDRFTNLSFSSTQDKATVHTCTGITLRFSHDNQLYESLLHCTIS